MDFEASADCGSARNVGLIVGWAGRYLVGAKFKLYVGVESNAPHVVLPVSLVIAQMLCVLVLALVLFLAVTIQLQGGLPSQTDSILLALFGGVAPIANAYGLNTNRVWTRIGLLINLLGLLIMKYLLSYGFIIPNRSRLALVVGSTAVFLAVLIFLYKNANVRAYYMAIRGLPIPDSLAKKNLKSPKRKLRLLGKFLNVAEILLLILVLILFPLTLAWLW